MPDEFVTQAEHREFEKRMEAEHVRQNHRLTELEEAVKNISTLTISVSKLAVSMEQMAEEQKKTNVRLTALEQEPAENWKKLLWILASAVVGALVGYFIH